MNKNPFSLYDFLGYVIPGGIALIFSWFALRGTVESISDILVVDDDLLQLVDWNNIIILLMAAYLVGHFISYVSTLTIERYALWNYGYPSKYLMGKGTPKSKYFIRRKVNWFNIVNYIWRVILLVLLLPLSFQSLVLGRLFKLNTFVLKSLDPFIQNSINLKYNILLKKLKLDITDEWTDGETDNHRIIYHYEYEKNDKQSRKMDNYVALYGFLRSITLIFVLLFDYLLYNMIKLQIWCKEIFIDYLLLLGIVGSVSYIFYLSYMKFYRRFTVETFMSLVTDADL